MPIKVECEICGAKYKVGDHRAGRRIPCKECGADMRVPGRGGAGRGGSGATVPLARARHRPVEDDDDFLEDAGDSNARLWMALGVGAVAAIGVIIAVIVSLSGGDEEPGDAVAQNDQAAAAANNPFNNAEPRPAPHVPPTFPSGQNPGNANGGAANGNAAGADAANDVPTPRPGFGANVPGQPAGGRPFGGVPDADPAGRAPRGFGDGQPLAGQPFGGAALPDAPPENWGAQADPRSTPLEFDLTREIDINLPSGAGVSDVLFPSCYAPFVAVGKFDDRQVVEIWNLQDKSRMGRIAGVRLGLGKRALSNDGKYFAAAGTSTEGVLVWDVKASKGLLQFPPPAESFYAALEFAGSSRLLAAQGGLGEDKPLYIWTIPEGAAERTLAVPKGTVAESLATSPGGRYLAMFVSHFDDQHLRVYDLTTGEVAGQALPPAVEFGGPRCQSLEFSPDGEELAGLFDAGRGSQIWIWNMNDGRLVDQIEFEDSLSWKFSKDHGRPVQWFPNKQRLLVYGDAVVDRAAKNIIFTFPENRSDRTPRQVLDDTRIAVVTGERTRGTVQAFELSEEVLAKAQAIVEQGGESVDAALPPLKQADLASARALLGGSASGWSVEADPVGSPPEPVLAEPLQVAAADGKLSGFWLADPAAARAALFYEVTNQPAAPARGRRPRPAPARSESEGPVRLEALDLATGRAAAKLTVPFPCKFLSMSPTGQRAVFALAKTEDRLDVYSIDDGQHVLGFRPYQTEENDGHKKVAAAVFVDDDHLLTMNTQHRLVLWDIGSANGVYQIEKAQEMLSSPPGLSPGNRYLVVFGDKLCHFYEALTGEARGTLTFDGRVAAAAFSPDGKRFAAITRSGNDARVYVWNAESGEIEKDFPLPKRNWAGSGMHFCGTDYLLFNGLGTEFVLIDIPHAVVAWTYRGAPWGQHHPISPDGRHWLLAPPRLGSKEIYLAALTLPSSVEKSRLESADLTPKFVVQPGSQVSLSITLPQQAPGHANFPEAVRKNLTERFQQHGITVVPNAETVVQVSMTEQSTGKTHKFHLFGRGDAEVPEKLFECKVVFVHQGQPVWESVSRISNDAFHVRVPEGQSLESVLSEQQWQAATGHFVSFQPPAHVFAEGAEKGYGNSQLTPMGPQ